MSSLSFLQFYSFYTLRRVHKIFSLLHESDSRDKYMSKEYCIQALRTTAIVVSVKSSVKQKQIFERESYLHKYNMVTTKKHISVSL